MDKLNQKFKNKKFKKEKCLSTVTIVIRHLLVKEELCIKKQVCAKDSDIVMGFYSQDKKVFGTYKVKNRSERTLYICPKDFEYSTSYFQVKKN